MAAKGKTKNYYSTYNFTTRVSIGTKVSVHDGDHDDVVRIFVRTMFPKTVEASKGGQWKDQCS